MGVTCEKEAACLAGSVCLGTKPTSVGTFRKAGSSGLLKGGCKGCGQSPHDPAIARKPHLWTLRFGDQAFVAGVPDPMTVLRLVLVLVVLLVL